MAKGSMVTQTNFTTLNWHDVKEGDELASLSFPITMRTLMIDVAGTRDLYPSPHDRDLAKTEIAPPEIGQASDLAVPGHAALMQVRKYVPADAIRLCSHCSMRCSPKAAFDARLPGVLATVVIEELARMRWP